MKNYFPSLIFVFGLIFSGCSHTSVLKMETLPENRSAIKYSVTYYIHADSDYLYHDPNGNPVRQNSRVLETAFDVAETAYSGEVFIFHQKPERKLLGLFPRRSSRFYHYKNGQLVNRVNYRHPDKQEAFLATEAQLMDKYRAQNRSDNHQNYLLYFGHEIPPNNGKGYHQTLPDIDVDTAALSSGIQSFLRSDHDRFSLVVLSTCNNGTPEMAERLIPFTDLLLASPQNLHLSHIDTDALTLLDDEWDTSPIPFQIARLMAEQTYERLSEEIQTTITLSLYKLYDVQDYIDSLASFTAARQESDPRVQFQDNMDCAELSFPNTAHFSDGVETWYKPARFGRPSGRVTHSGWGCKPNPGVR